MKDARPTAALFGRGTLREVTRIGVILRRETVGGALLLVATLLALGWANSPWSQSYQQLQALTIGPGALHLDFTLGEWAADGLLAIFFSSPAWNSNANSSPATCDNPAARFCR